MKHRHHLGIYALIPDKSGEAVLLIKKARGPYIGMLDLPGGSLEDGELLEEALAREVMEETGCRMVSCRQLGTESILFDYTEDKTGISVRLRHIGILYQAATDDTASTEGDGLDSNGTLWLPLSEIAHHQVTPLVQRAIARSGLLRPQ